jgi:DNA-binding transcriptional ArsR family regulator
MTDTKEKRAEVKATIRKVRKERGPDLDLAREGHKPVLALRRQIVKLLEDGPATVPALAAEVDAPTDDVLWHLMAMRKYGLLVEGEQDGGYFQYELVTETEEGE